MGPCGISTRRNFSGLTTMKNSDDVDDEEAEEEEEGDGDYEKR
jgi:hypothetical protein